MSEEADRILLNVAANVASAIVKLVAIDALPLLMSNLVVGNLVHRDFEPVEAQAGDTVNMPMPPNNALIVLNRHMEASFQIPDITKALAVPELLKIYMQPAAIALAERIDADLLDLHAQFILNAPIGAPGAPVTEATFDAAGRLIPPGMRYMVVNPGTYSAIRQLPGFTEYSAASADLRVSVGTLGKMKDFYIFRSNLVPRTGSAPIATHNLAFSGGAIGLVMRYPPTCYPKEGVIFERVQLDNFGMRVTMGYQRSTLAQMFTLDVLYGVGVLRNGLGVRVES